MRCAADLAGAIEAEKASLVGAGAISKPKTYLPVRPDDLPDVFKNSSTFVPLGQIARIEKGQTGIKQAVPGDYPLVVTAAKRSSCDHFDFEGAAAVIPLVSATGHGNASINRLHYQEGKFALGTILAAVFPYAPEIISARFLFEYLSTFKDELLVSRMTGTANVTLTIGRIAEVPVPLISPEVQGQLDAFMVLCDQLEAARAEREAGRDMLTAATLARLNAPDPETFSADARFALDNLTPLTTRPDQIKQLRQTVLNLAVQGQLVNSGTPMTPGVLKDIGDFVSGNGFPKHFQGKCEGGFPFLKVSDMNILGNERRIVHANNYVSEDDLHSMRATTYPAGTVIFPKIGGAIATNKRRVLSCASAIDNNCAGQVPKDGISVDWLYLVLSTIDMSKYQAGTAVPALSMKALAEHAIMIPSENDQHQIVAKVDELMTLCDQLEASLTAGEETRSRLLVTVLHNALEVA